MMNASKSLIVCCFTLVILVSCATIPREAADLSSELGKRVSALESSHMVLLHRFFDQKRADVDRLIEDEWIPVFAEQFFGNPAISQAWNTIVSENNKQERLKFITIAGPKLQAKINEKRLELTKPLDDLERRIEKTIKDEYERTRSINNTLTSFLVSASKVEENRKRYLEMIGVTDDKVGAVIEKTDEVVSDFLGKARTVKEKTETVEAYLEKLRTIKNSL